MVSKYSQLKEDLIDRGNLESFEEFEQKLYSRGRYPEALLYALTVSNDLISKRNAGRYEHNFMNIGGYGILGHIVSLVGPEAALRWRGSHDLDIICKDKETADMITRDYADENIPSLSLPNKRQVSIRDPLLNDPIQLDLYYPNQKGSSTRRGIQIGHSYILSDEFDKGEVVDMFGIPFRVYDRLGLLKLKLGIMTEENLPRPKDMTDIMNLLGIAEQKKEDPQSFSSLDEEERIMLYNVIDHKQPHPQMVIDDAFCLIAPTPKYLGQIRKTILVS